MRAVVDQDITPTDRLVGQLPDDWDVTVGLEGTTEAAASALAHAGVAFVTSRIPVGREVLEAAPDLEVVAKLGTGIDNVDLEAAAERSVAVTYTPGHNALSVAEHTLALLLATARRLPEMREILESGGWRDDATLGTRLSGKTVGIVGFGNVGKRVGKLLSGFQADVLVHDPYVPTIDAEFVGGELVDLDDLLRLSDAVVVNAELTEETRGYLGEREFSLMKEDAFLVNTARGPIVEEDALVSTLRSSEIAGAGLDVYASEPPGEDSPLLDLDNVVLTPHVAAMTNESRAETIDTLAANVLAILEGEPVQDRYRATPG